MNRSARISAGACLLALLTASAARAQAPQPKPGPEQQALAVMVGTWACEFTNSDNTKASALQTCEITANGFFLQCRYQMTPGVDTTTVTGYDVTEKAYRMFRYRSNGLLDYSSVFHNGNTWAFVYDSGRRPDGKLRRQEARMTVSPNALTIKWEASVEGEPWRVTQTGTCTKRAGTTPSGGR